MSILKRPLPKPMNDVTLTVTLAELPAALAAVRVHQNCSKVGEIVQSAFQAYPETVVSVEYKIVTGEYFFTIHYADDLQKANRSDKIKIISDEVFMRERSLGHVVVLNTSHTDRLSPRTVINFLGRNKGD